MSEIIVQIAQWIKFQISTYWTVRSNLGLATFSWGERKQTKTKKNHMFTSCGIISLSVSNSRYSIFNYLLRFLKRTK